MFGFIKELFEWSIDNAKYNTKLRMPKSFRSELFQLESYFFSQRSQDPSRVVDLGVSYTDRFLQPDTKPAIRMENGNITKLPLASIVDTFRTQARGLPTPTEKAYILRCNRPFVKKLDGIKNSLGLPDIESAALVSVEFLRAVKEVEMGGGQVGELKPLMSSCKVISLHGEKEFFEPFTRDI